MTQTLVESEIFIRPIEEALAAARAAGLLPERVTDRVWKPDPAQVQPAFGLLSTLTPKAPFTAKGYLSATRPDYFQAGNTPYIAMQSKPGIFDGVVWHSFNGLGANRQCIIWLSLRVYGASSLIIGGTGNPSQLTVSHANTGGQTVSVPFGMTATSDGRAYLYIVPAQDNQGGEWYSSSLYGL
jgi:hypothetical protein